VGPLISSPLVHQIDAFPAARHLSHSEVILRFRMFALVWSSSSPRMSYAGRDPRSQSWYLLLPGSDCFKVARVVPLQRPDRHWSFLHCLSCAVEGFQAPRLWVRTWVGRSVGILPPSLEVSHQRVEPHERDNGHDTSRCCLRSSKVRTTPQSHMGHSSSSTERPNPAESVDSWSVVSTRSQIRPLATWRLEYSGPGWTNRGIEQ